MIDEAWQIAPDVYCLGPHGRSQTNVYFVHGGSSWFLIDAGWERDLPRIVGTAERRFGTGRGATAILLTHDHPDHAGAARELARRWTCPVYVHPAELAVARGSFKAMWADAGPLDRYLILPAISALGRRRRDAMLERDSLRGVVAELTPGGAVPGLPDWRWVHTPGHTPGHVSYHRPSDGVLITGDALVTLRVNELAGMLRGRQGLSEPPWYTTPSRTVARTSIAQLAELAPRFVGSGHGRPLTGSDTADRVRAFAASLAGGGTRRRS